MRNYCLMDAEFQFCKIERVLEIGCTTTSMYGMPLNRTLKDG